ncbi:alpha/beta hydrolase family protein [Dyella acidiphila]|uniref:S9 family peptidase n=1 Tax=Dyella acidiphila TaxID=2775866 RepID=A0ABR9G4R1_9GAMM|nr:prolyl oligopeptidase family serine peptidase [Dyella acidiphila]MBE1159016.1 S9 family peptidase [Dyella acidiphila]
MKTIHGLRLLAAVLLSLACGQPTLAQNTPAPAAPSFDMSVQGMLRRPDFSDVQISPDGQYFAALVPNDDKPYENMLAVFNTQTRQPVDVMRSGRTLIFNKYFWAAGDRVVTSIGMRRGGFDQPVLTGELLAFNADGSQIVDLFGARSRNAAVRSASFNDQAFPITTEPAINRNILVAVRAFSADRAGVYTEARLVNIDGGTETNLVISPGRNASFIADHRGKPRIAYTYDEGFRNTLWQYSESGAHPKNNLLLRTPDTAYIFGHTSQPTANYSSNGSWRVLNNPATSHIMLEPIGFDRSNNGLYVKVEYGKRPAAIALYDLVTHKLKLLYQGKFADPGQMLPTADGKDYYAVITQDGEKSLFYFDPNSPEAQMNQAAAAKFPGQLAYFSSFSLDGKRAILTVVSDRNPGSYFLFDFAARNAAMLVTAEPWIDVSKMRPMQPITLNARDGLPLHGFLTLPAGKGPYPLIVLPHGGPIDVSDTWTFDAETQLFAGRGYAVLRVNYRGSGGSGMWFQGLGYKQWGLSMQDDLTDATRWAIAQGYAEPGRICIYGGSYGGYAALEGAVREPDLYKCAIGYDGTYDLRVQVADSDTEKSDAGDMYLRNALGQDQDDLLRRSPIAGVAQIKADILLLHGGEDLRTPYKSFKEFTRALDHADKHYDTLVESHEGHGFYPPKHRQEAYEKMLEFLDRNIGGPTATSNATAKASP